VRLVVTPRDCQLPEITATAVPRAAGPAGMRL